MLKHVVFLQGEENTRGRGRGQSAGRGGPAGGGPRRGGKDVRGRGRGVQLAVPEFPQSGASARGVRLSPEGFRGVRQTFRELRRCRVEISRSKCGHVRVCDFCVFRCGVFDFATGFVNRSILNMCGFVQVYAW